MLAPKRVKWRKQQKGHMAGKALRGGSLQYGDVGLQGRGVRLCDRAPDRGSLVSRVSKYTKKGGQMWIRIFPDKPRTKKAAETRHG